VRVPYNSLPIASSCQGRPSPPDARPHMSFPKAALPGTTRVIICDYNSLLQSVSGLLRMSGYCVFQAYNGQAAVELCGGLMGIGLLVLNTEGTGMDTPALVRSIRKTSPGLPVLHIGTAPIPACLRCRALGRVVHRRTTPRNGSRIGAWAIGAPVLTSRWPEHGWATAWMALVLGEGIAKPGATAMGEDYKEQLDDFKRKMEKHRTKIQEHTQETQEQVEKAEQRQRNAEEPESPLSDRTE
jgi:hypothetical protein